MLWSCGGRCCITLAPLMFRAVLQLLNADGGEVAGLKLPGSEG